MPRHHFVRRSSLTTVFATLLLLLTAVCYGQLTLTTAALNAGFNLTTFAQGFPVTDNAGPLGIVFPTANSVLVSDWSGAVRLFTSDVDGQDARNAVVGANYGSHNVGSLGILNGHIYVCQDAGTLIEVNADGTDTGNVILTGLNLPRGMAVDTQKGLIYLAEYGTQRILLVDPIKKTASVFIVAGYFDGIALSADGSVLYASRIQQNYISGFRTSDGVEVFQSGAIGAPDGIAFGKGVLKGNLIVNTNYGVVYAVDIATGSPTVIASGGSRGDYVAIDPNNGTILITQSDRIMRIDVAARLTALSVPAVLTGGISGTGTLTLSSAPTDDGMAILASSVPKTASIPSAVTVLAGQPFDTFPITTFKVTSDIRVTMFALLDGVTRTANLIVTPTRLTSLTVSPAVVMSGKSATGTVKLSNVAPDGGWLVALSSDNAAAVVPNSVVVPAGSSVVKFPIVSTYPDAVTTANISAMFGGTTKTVPLTVNPITLVSLTLTPSTVFGGTSVSVKLTINALAPTGGKTVTLSSGNSAANCPASVVVPAGKSSVTFKMTTSNPAATTTGDISAALGGVTISAPLTVNHAVVTKLSIAFLPNASRYARGTVITLQATLLDETGAPIVGKTVTLKEYVSALGTRTTLGALTTDANGRVLLTYTVPTDPAKDNVYIEAYFAGDVAYLPAPKASKRIPIGT